MSFPSTLKLKQSPQEPQAPSQPSTLKPRPSTLKLKEAPPSQEKGPEEEGLGKSVLRYAAQIPLGLAQVSTPGIISNLLHLLGTGAALDPEEIDQIRRISEQEGIPFDEEAYLQSVQRASELFPTPTNLARMAEEETGLPLEAKTRGQRLAQLAASAGGSTIGSLPQKLVASAAAPAASAALEKAGLPEEIADIAGFAAGVPLGSKLKAQPIKKPSGLTARRYEELEKPRKVSPAVQKRILEKTESEFKDIADRLIQKGEGAKTYNALKNDSEFKNRVSDLFREVETSAAEITEPISTSDIKKKIAQSYRNVSKKGFADNAHEKAYKKLVKENIKDIRAQNVSAQQLVEQYRKNNRALGEHYNPTRSRAENRAQKDALLDFNRAIAETIQEKYPDSEFSKLFEFTNRQWANIKDAEYVDQFMSDMFSGKINYAKGKKFFERENAQLPFKRIMGEEGFEKFESLMNDLLSTEEANKLLKSAQSHGMGDLAKAAAAYVVHPALGKTVHGLKVSQGAWNALLDKPQMAIKWKKGVESYKKGNFAEAAKIFSEIEANHQKSPTDSLQKIEK